MPREILRQSNFTGGELDPRCVGRRDLKAYASSLALAVNLLPLPQGPVRRRPGLRHADWIRNRLELVDLSGVTVTAPNGGDGPDLITGETPFQTVTALGTTDGYVIAELDFGAPVEIGLVDLINFALVPAGTSTGDPDPDPSPPQFPWWKDPNAAFEVEP